MAGKLDMQPGTDPPAGRLLDLLRADVERNGPPDAAGIARLGRLTGTPAATLRGIVSSYADLRDGPADLRVCRGTSCELGGARALHRRLERSARCRAVRCLGHCHGPPAALRRDGVVVVHAGAPGAETPAMEPAGGVPSVRCLAPEPVVTRRLGPRAGPELARARARGAWDAVARARALGPRGVLDAVDASGLRGRGGAGFPTGRKWRLAAEAGAAPVVVANGDEGDPGSFADRILMEQDPHGILEGMALCALATGARRGIVFVRSEYPAARTAMERAVADARAAALLGPGALGPGHDLEIEVVGGHGSYVCGEETALIAALEGRRCEARPRPPYPVTSGLGGRPTVVDNVETLVATGWILERGPEAYAALGTAATRGTKALSLNHGFARPGLVEVEFGVPLGAIVEEAGGGAEGPLAAVLLGGPMGSVVTPERLDVPLCHGAMAARGVEPGHGGLVAVPRGADPVALADHLLSFMAEESCGRCVPCARGSGRALDRLRAGGPADERLHRLLDVVSQGSLCAFGQRIPVPVRELLALAGAAA